MAWRTAILASLLIAVSFPVQAACAQRDLQGRWDMYPFGISGRGEIFAGRCLLTFTERGRAQGRCEGPGAVTLAGQITLRPNCRGTGTITRRSGGAAIACRMQATMAMGKDVASGFAICGRNEIVFTFDLVKLP
jgi:hypothetical protein